MVLIEEIIEEPITKVKEKEAGKSSQKKEKEERKECVEERKDCEEETKEIEEETKVCEEEAKECVEERKVCVEETKEYGKETNECGEERKECEEETKDSEEETNECEEETKECLEEKEEYVEETKEGEAQQGAEEMEEEEEEEDTREDLEAKSDAAVLRQLQLIEEDGKQALIAEKYNYAHGKFKEGLRAIADWLHMKRDDPEFLAILDEKQRLMAVNGALCCLKVGNYQQGLECAQLVLDKGALTPEQHHKALYRAGVCCRGMGDLKEARKYLKQILEIEGISDSTKRSVYKELLVVKEEAEDYKKFAQGFLSGKGKEVVEEKKPLTEAEIKKQMEMEKRRERYIEAKKMEKEREERNATKEPPTVPEPDVLIAEEDCIEMLDMLIERYSDKDVKEELRLATMDHEYSFSKGFIFRSRKVLEPVQKDVLEKYGFLKASDDYNSDVHHKALMESVKTIRYLGTKNPLIAQKAEQAKDLAYGGGGGLIDTIEGLGSQ